MRNQLPRSLTDEAGFVNKRSGYEIMVSVDGGISGRLL